METLSDNDLMSMDFEVESVLGTRATDEGMEYHIKWKGFPPSESTWETEENLLSDALLENVKAKMVEIEKAAEKKKTARTQRLKRFRNRGSEFVRVAAISDRVAQRAKAAANIAAEKTVEGATKAVKFGVALGKFHVIIAEELSKGGYSYAERSAKKAVKEAKRVVKKVPGKSLRAVAELARLQKKENRHLRKLPFGIPNMEGIFSKVEMKTTTFTKKEAADVHAKLNDAMLRACGQVLEPLKLGVDDQYLNAKRMKRQMELIEKITKSRDRITEYYQEKRDFEAKRSDERFDMTIDALADYLDRLSFIADQHIEGKQGPVNRQKMMVLKKNMDEAAKHVYMQILQKFNKEKENCQKLVNQFKDFVADDPRLANGSPVERKQKNDIASMIALTMLRIHDAKNGEQYSYDFGKISAKVPDAYDVNLTNFLADSLKKTGISSNKTANAFAAGLEGALESLFLVPWIKEQTKSLNFLTSVMTWGNIASLGSKFVPFLSGPMQAVNAATILGATAKYGDQLYKGAQFSSNSFRKFISVIINLFLDRIRTLDEQLKTLSGGSTFMYFVEAGKYVGKTALFTKFWLAVQVMFSNLILNQATWLLTLSPALVPYALQIMNLCTGAAIISLRLFILKSGFVNDRETLKNTFEKLQANILQNKKITDKDQKNLSNLLVLRSKNASYGASFVARLCTVSTRDFGWYLLSPFWSSLSIMGGGAWLYSVIGIGAKSATIQYGNEEFAAICTHDCKKIEVRRIGDSTDVRELDAAEAKEMGISLGDNDKVPSQAYEKLTQEFTTAKFLLALYANEQMASGSMNGFFNALQIQGVAGEDTFLNRFFNFWLNLPFTQWRQSVESGYNNLAFGPKIKMLGKSNIMRMEQQLKQKQKQREKKIRENHERKARKDLNNLQSMKPSAEKRRKLQELSDRVAYQDIDDSATGQGGNFKSSLKKLAARNNEAMKTDAKKAVSDAMDSILDATGYEKKYGVRTLPKSEKELVDAMKKLPVAERIDLKGKLKDGVKKCEKIADDCRFDRKLFGFHKNSVGFSLNTMFDINKLLGDKTTGAPLFDLEKNTTADLTDQQKAAPTSSRNETEQPKQAQSDDTEELSPQDVKFAAEALKDNAFQFFNKPLLDWLKDSKNQKKVVNKAIADGVGEPRDEALKKLNNAKKAMNKAATNDKKTTDALKDRLDKEMDFTKIASEMSMEQSITAKPKTSEDVKQMLRDGVRTGEVEDVNNTLRNYLDKFNERARQGKLNDPSWQPPQPGNMNNADENRQQLPTPGGTNGLKKAITMMRPPRPPKNVIRNVNGHLGLRRKQQLQYE